MSSPRDRFDDRDESSGWQEPAHLGGEGTGGDGDAADGAPKAPHGPGGADGPDADPPNFADRRVRPRDDQWPPPGWDLPPAERNTQPPAQLPAPEPDAQRQPDEPGAGPWGGRDAGPAEPPPAARSGGLFGGGRPRRPGEVEKVFAYQGDLLGVQAWAVQYGWTVSDGTAPEDAVLGELVTSAPAPRLDKDSRAAGVLRGRADALDLVAFDVVHVDGRRVVPQYAVTAAPLLTPVPYFRLSPARFWKHRTGGLVPVESGDPMFDSRWMLLAGEDGPAVRRLAADPTVRALLLNTDDGDEFWSAAGHVAVIRPDGHRPQLVEHHARLLTAVVRALAGVG